MWEGTYLLVYRGVGEDEDGSGDSEAQDEEEVLGRPALLVWHDGARPAISHTCKDPFVFQIIFHAWARTPARGAPIARKVRGGGT